jgi:hypothetical protein
MQIKIGANKQLDSRRDTKKRRSQRKTMVVLIEMPPNKVEELQTFIQREPKKFLQLLTIRFIII